MENQTVNIITTTNFTPLSPSHLTPKKRSKKIFIICTLLFILIVVALMVIFLTSNDKKDIDMDEGKAPTEKVQISNQPTNSINKKNKQAVNNRTFQVDTLTNFTKEELSNLGVVSLPVGFTIQEEYKGVKLVRSPKASFSKSQLNLLHYYLDLTPQKLLSPGPAAIVMFKADEVEAGPFGISMDTVAFASGPYVFFNEESFTGRSLKTDSSDQAYTSFEHELTHIAQFNENLSDIYDIAINQKSENPIYWTDASIRSSFIENFAKISGWEKSETDSYGKKIFKYQLSSPENAKTTEYGKTAIVEDMAESVSGVIATCNYQFDAKRVQWVLDYLKVTLDSLKPGKLPCNSGYQKVQAWFPDIDYDKKEAYKNKYGFSDTQVYVNEKVNSLNEAQSFYQTELNSRGWTGTLNKVVKEDGVEIYKGDFSGNNRDIYLEMKSYDNATGFAEKPVGTTVNIISGYDF